MPKRPPPPPLSYVLRTSTARTEYKGSHAEGLAPLFVALPDALARRKVLDKLEKAHAKMLAREAGPDLEQQTAAQVGALADGHYLGRGPSDTPPPGGGHEVARLVRALRGSDE